MSPLRAIGWGAAAIVCGAGAIVLLGAVTFVIGLVGALAR